MKYQILYITCNEYKTCYYTIHIYIIQIYFIIDILFIINLLRIVIHAFNSYLNLFTQYFIIFILF
jgi:hypothetical protein